MALGIGLIFLALAGLCYGMLKKRKAFIVSSIILLVILLLIWVVYSYLYSLNPY